MYASSGARWVVWQPAANCGGVARSNASSMLTAGRSLKELQGIFSRLYLLGPQEHPTDRVTSVRNGVFKGSQHAIYLDSIFSSHTVTHATSMIGRVISGSLGAQYGPCCTLNFWRRARRAGRHCAFWLLQVKWARVSYQPLSVCGPLF